ncbi:MAG: ComEC/Rec2 family competence protein [Planctomycetota bacterium]
MQQGPHRALGAAVAWSLPAAVLAAISLPAAVLLAALGVCTCVATRHPLRHAGLLALPILLCAMPRPAAPATPFAAGPVHVDGLVADVRRTPQTGQTDVTFAGGLRLRFAHDVEVVPGDRLRTLALARPAAVPEGPLRLRAVPATADVTPGSFGFARGCALLRRSFERSLLELVPGPHGAMLATLVLGRATRPDFALTEAHRATGLSHLLAVSGAHAAMLAFLLGLTTRGRHLGAGRARTWFVLALLSVYGCIAGAEPPVLRAVVAFALAAVAARTGRPFGVARGLLIPALVTAAVDPQALTGPSFLLSYAAVIGLGLALRGRRPAGLRGWLLEALRASFWATLLTTPLTLWFFGQLAPSTILLTPLCAPLVAAMLLLGLVAATLLAICPPLAGLLAWPLQAIAACYAAIVHAADGLPGTPIPATHVPPVWALVLATAAAAALVACRPRRSSIVVGVFAITSLWFVPLRAAAKPALQLFAIGHGQAALLTGDDGTRIAVDCGSLQGGGLPARKLCDALSRRSLDVLVVTHADQDHHNGVERLLPRLRIRHAVLPQALADTALHAALSGVAERLTLLAPGQRTELGSATVFAPDLPAAASDNDRSLWVRATIGRVDVLLAGDAQELGIAAALADGIATAADVLVLPHHGRPNRNAPHLLARVRPRACFASAASGDGDTALGRLARRFGTELWVTGRHGDLRLDGDSAVVRASHAPPLPQAAPPPQQGLR